MSEEKIKRRGWVKNAAIIFLALMLVFTLFSNTFMNRSLPEVVAVATQRASITTRVRGQGTVSANESYEVTMKETRELLSVPVKLGQMVEIGDVLAYLSDADSAEVEAAEEELEQLRVAYEKALVGAPGYNYQQEQLNIQRAQEDLNKLIADKAKGEVSDEEIKAAQDKVDARDANIAAYLEQIDYYEHLAELARENGEPDFGYLSLRDTAKANLDLEREERKLDAQALADLEARRDSYAELDSLILSAQRNIEDMVLALNRRQTEDGKTQALSAIDLREMRNAIDDKVAEIDKLRGNDTGSEVVSMVRGTVRQINFSAGKTVTPNDTLMLIDVADRGYTVSFPVTNEQASKVQVGDVGDVTSYMWGVQINAILDSIRNDPTKPGGQGKMLTFIINGEVNAGDQLTITVGQRSSEYEVVVPNSAVRTDMNGDFVYQLTAKSSPLGNRYIATRVPVTVLAKDDMNTAIESSLGKTWESDFVITTSSRPLEHGMMVKQVDN